MSIKDTRVEKLLLFSSVPVCLPFAVCCCCCCCGASQCYSCCCCCCYCWFYIFKLVRFARVALEEELLLQATTAIFLNYGWLTKPSDKQTERESNSATDWLTNWVTDCPSEWAHSAELSSCLWSAYPQISDTWMCSTSDWPSGWRWARLAPTRLDWEQSSVKQRHRSWAQHWVWVWVSDKSAKLAFIYLLCRLPLAVCHLPTGEAAAESAEVLFAALIE